MIVKNEDGTYSVMISGNGAVTGANEEVTSRVFKTKKEARDYELGAISFVQPAAGGGMYSDLLFDELLDAFEKEKRVRVRPSTFLSYSVTINRFIRPVFTGKLVRMIEPTDVRAWQNGMLQMGYTPQYLRKVNSLLNAVFNYGIRFYGLKTNPARMAGAMGCCSSKKVNFWTLEEFSEFIGHVKDPRYHLIYDILYWTGIRVGELLALTPADIDLERSCITISKTYRRYHRQDIISPPKTKKSNRTVYLHHALAEELKAYMKTYRVSEEERLFDVHFDSVRDRLDRIVAKTGLKRIKIHDFRHSHASLLINLNISPLLVSERLGHEKVETTLNVYSHLYPDMQQKLTEMLDAKCK